MGEIVTNSLSSSLKTVNSAEDLGVVITSDPTWSKRVNAVIKKADKIFALIHRPVDPSGPEASATLYNLMYKMVYEERLNRLKWLTLESCRLYLSLLECYKTVLA